jgi:pseudouridine-5'-phosphate glycosidase
VPIPAADEALGAGVEAAIGQALSQAEEEHVIGNAVTPFLLKRIR